MDRRKINLAFIRLEHFLEQCVKLKGPNPPSIPTAEMAKNVKDELVYLLDHVKEIACDNMPAVLEVLNNARLRDIPGILKHCEKALDEFIVCRSNFIRLYDSKQDDNRYENFPIQTMYPQLQPDTDYMKLMLKRRESTDLGLNMIPPEPKTTPRYHPSITDLGDMNRPSRIAERLNNLYNNEWTEAYEDLRRLYKHEIQGHERGILELATILRRANEFTQDMADKQIMKMSKMMKMLMLQPSDDLYMNSDNDVQVLDVADTLVDIRFSKYAKKCLKENADLSLVALKKGFEWRLRRERIRDILQIQSVKAYCHRCLHITWFMNVQDPPMCLLWPSDVRRSELNGTFRFFTRAGTSLRHEVWPALMLTSEGPLMIKGVAEFK